jgi:hypothetical protein
VFQNSLIYGVVTNELSENLSSANIKLTDRDGKILIFTITDDSGSYKITPPKDSITNNLFIEVSYFGYKTKMMPFSENRFEYNFSLLPEPTFLEEIVVKNRPLIERKKDTLSYNVQKFAKTQDKSIGNVMSRLPGIRVSNDGAIYYNDEKIENLYIHGDDLMAGKYGLATKAIRKEDILSIDVIRNHQPVKVLQDKSSSDKTAINLVLKDEDNFKLSTRALLGLGVPKQYDISITPILLNKNIKLLNQISSNNSGTDYRRDFKELGSSNFLTDNKNYNVDFSLSQGTVGVPDLPVSNYFINKSTSLNFNNLYTFKNSTKLRVNLQALIDRNTLEYKNVLTNFTPNDTIVFNQNQSLLNKQNLLFSSFNLTKNLRDYFLSNTLKLNISEFNNSSTIDFNNNSFSQNLYKHDFNISNDFSFVPQINERGILEVRLLSEYNIKEDNLMLDEGFDLPQSFIQDYDTVNQLFNMPSFNIDGYVSYKLTENIIKQDHRIGYLYENRQFNSSLILNSENDSNEYNGDFGNQLNWSKTSYYLASNFRLERDKIIATVDIPIIFQNINYSQEEYNLDKNRNDFLINPLISFEYRVNVERRLKFNYNYKNTFGDVSNVFRGLILQDFRTILASNADLQIQNVHFLDLRYSFENAAELIFFNGGVSYKVSEMNNILSTSIKEDIITNSLLPFENNQEDITLRLGISNYIFPLKTKVSLNTQFVESNFQNLINDILVPFKSRNLSLSSSFSKTFLNIFNLDYVPTAIWNSNKILPSDLDFTSEAISYRTFRFDQDIDLTITPAKRWNMGLNSNYTIINQQNSNRNDFFLLNINAKHILKKSGLEIVLDVNNLLDVKQYRLLTIDSSQLINNSYSLRGRMIIARIDWYF